jgi:hypothetical protein
MNSPQYKQEEYARFFPETIRKEALDTALDIRKFEIDLYWKRAAYFWTFIAAAFVAFGAAQQLKDEASKTDLSLVVCCLGTVFSWAWFLINKGSKYWQMNWEKHVDMLEDSLIGPLYKTNWLLDELESSSAKVKLFLIEGGRFSVTRINQLVRFFVLTVWLVLMVHVLPFERHGRPNLFYILLVVATVLFCGALVVCGKTGRGVVITKFKMREAKGDISDTPSTSANTPKAVANDPI